MLGLAAGRLAAVLAAEEGKADANALRLAKRQLHSQNVFERLSAIERLQEGPPLAAAKMVVPAVLNDSSADVRRAAADALLTWKDDREVCVFLLKSLKQEFLGKKNNPQVGVPLLMALAASELPETRDDLNKFSASREGLLAVAMVADELGKRGDERALTSLKRMSELKCFSSTYACRRAIVGAMISIRTRPSLDALLTLLPHLDGEVRGDVLRHLTAVSSQHFSTDIKAWQAWWKEQKESFQFPAKGPDIRLVQDAPPGTSAYYGMTIYARRMVFVLDISGSMDRRLPAAERKLLTAIDGLPDEAFLQHRDFQQQGHGLATEPDAGDARQQRSGEALCQQSPGRRTHGRL